MRYAIISLTVVLLWVPATMTFAQTGNHVLSAATGFKVLDINSGNSLLVVERRFGFDSTYVELLHADAGWNTTQLSSRRFVSPLYFLFDAVQLSSGPLVTGLFPGLSISSLYRMDNNGSLAWSVTIDGMVSSQRRFVKLFADGDDFIAYSNADGFGSDTFYRLEGDGTGASWSALEFSTNDMVPQRFYEGVAVGPANEHILVGSRIAFGDAQALIARIDPLGVVWMKQYDLGSLPIESEEASNVTALNGGEFACVMTARETENTTAGYVMRFNGSGDPIWTTKLTDPAGVYLAAIVQLDDGSLLVSSITNSNTRRLYRLSANGELLWARGCVTCIGSVNEFWRTSSGGLIGNSGGTLFEFTPDGMACGFDEVITSVTASSFSPVVSAVTATSTSVVLTSSNVPVLERTPVNTLSPTCVVSVEELPASAGLQVWPVPSRGMVYLDRPTASAFPEPYVLRAVDGRMVGQGIYQNGIDIGLFPSGAYVMELPRSRQRVRLVRE